MRLIAILVVIVTGALMLCMDALPDIRGLVDEFGVFMVVAGLIALTLELYVIPVLANHSSQRDK